MFDNLAQRHPTLGPLLWVSGICYYIVQLIVASAWPRRYSLAKDFISDLGNTACAMRAGVYICSPLHALMNISFVIIGLALILGSVLLYRNFRSGRRAIFCFTLVGLAGVATVIVGIIPENDALTVHSYVAGVGLFCLNAGVAGFYLLQYLPSSLRMCALASGCIGFIALVFFGFHTAAVLGRGGFERVADYTPDIWLIIFGLYALTKAKHHLPINEVQPNEHPYRAV